MPHGLDIAVIFCCSIALLRHHFVCHCCKSHPCRDQLEYLNIMVVLCSLSIAITFMISLSLVFTILGITECDNYSCHTQCKKNNNGDNRNKL